MTGGSSTSSQLHHQPPSTSSSRGGGKQSSNPDRQIIITNLVYQGRKIVSDINHLYDVVNDREAHENYDVLMEIISNTTNAAAAASSASNAAATAADDSDRLSDVSGGSSSHYSRSSGRGNNNSNLERKLVWARMKEEEVLDRMLSQFPVSSLRWLLDKIAVHSVAMSIVMKL